MYGNNNNPAPGTAGGRCLPSVMIRGEPQPRCRPGLNCTTSGDLGVPRCMAPAPGPRPAPGSRGGPCRTVGSGQLGMPCDRNLRCAKDRCVPMKRPVPPPRPRPIPTHLIKSYECNSKRSEPGFDGLDCIARDDGNGQYKTLEECINSKECRSARLRDPTWMCNPHRNEMLGSKQCLKVFDGSGMYKSEAECDKHCGSAHIRTGYSCPSGTKVGGGACKKVAGIPGFGGVFSDPASCAAGSNCHAKPVSLMRDPYWSIGSVESDPLMFMMSNVGDAGGRIQNFMGE